MVSDSCQITIILFPSKAVLKRFIYNLVALSSRKCLSWLVVLVVYKIRNLKSLSQSSKKVLW